VVAAPLPPLPPPPDDPHPVAATTPAPATETPASTTDAAPSSTPVDEVVRDIEEARGDPDRLAALVRTVSRELFVDVPRGRDHLELLARRSGWAESPLRARWVTAMQALCDALDEDVEGWPERERRLALLADATRERYRASLVERLARAVDAELANWFAFVDGVSRVRLALGDPRGEAQVLEGLASLPEDRFVREDARALLAMARAADMPDRWVRIADRRAEVTAAVAELQDRLGRTALGRVLGADARVVARVLERQLADPQASRSRGCGTRGPSTWAAARATRARRPTCAPAARRSRPARRG
jgi:hypothetical protein